MHPPYGGGGIINRWAWLQLTGYVTEAVMTFDKQSNGRSQIVFVVTSDVSPRVDGDAEPGWLAVVCREVAYRRRVWSRLAAVDASSLTVRRRADCRRPGVTLWGLVAEVEVALERREPESHAESLDRSECLRCLADQSSRHFVLLSSHSTSRCQHPISAILLHDKYLFSLRI